MVVLLLLGKNKDKCCIFEKKVVPLRAFEDVSPAIEDMVLMCG